MNPNSNSDAEINVWCDWLTDNGRQDLADEIRFEEQNVGWYYEARSSATWELFRLPSGFAGIGKYIEENVGVLGYVGGLTNHVGGDDCFLPDDQIVGA